LHTIQEAEIAAQLGLRGRIVWQAKGLNVTFENSPEGERWQVKELCSLSALIVEGRALCHCVASYAGRCVSGSSAIFSLQKNGMRVLTIELNCYSGRVVQVRGKSNKPASAAEAVVVRQWIESVVSPSEEPDTSAN
jgi:hypothetical protein